ncbi:MAG: hypothetical protein LBI05_04895 [Planctomycetaceae bacterium]|nr:hypothetical protein [Planctomycetaceae bacterium]
MFITTIIPVSPLSGKRRRSGLLFATPHHNVNNDGDKPKRQQNGKSTNANKN